MPGPQLTTVAFILGRQTSGSDNFEQLTAFSEEHGVLLCLARLPKAAASSRRSSGAQNESRLDLFDEAELSLESASQGRTWFIKEHRHLHRFPGIGRSYDALRAAAALASLVSRNPISDESRAPVIVLLRQSLGALETGARPDLVWLKSLYIFLRDEGYPVKQQWWQQLGSDDRAAAAQILNHPIAGQNPAPSDVARLTERLQTWLAAETEIHLK
ncbi:MAG TPA: hypothetical protein VK477_09300 [Acidobacteriota bacterium]|nr:hypothetical protein [Acidobacteriota bacterium]